jgi:hypothetical protein
MDPPRSVQAELIADIYWLAQATQAHLLVFFTILWQLIAPPYDLTQAHRIGDS